MGMMRVFLLWHAALPASSRTSAQRYSWRKGSGRGRVLLVELAHGHLVLLGRAAPPLDGDARRGPPPTSRG